MALECGEWSILQRNGLDVKAIPLPCKRWSCLHCRAVKKRRLLRCLKGTHVTALLTLTCRPSHFRDPHQAFVYLSAQVPHLMKRLRRAFPAAPIEYFTVWESTKAGWPHAHLLLRSPYIPQRLISRHWYQLARSPIVDIRSVRSQKDVAAYLSKYLTKQPVVPPGYRRFRTSLAFWQADHPNRSRHDPDDPPWLLSRFSVFDLAESWSRTVYSLEMLPSGGVIARYVGLPPPTKKQESSHGKQAAFGQRF